MICWYILLVFVFIKYIQKVLRLKNIIVSMNIKAHNNSLQLCASVTFLSYFHHVTPGETPQLLQSIIFR